MIPFVSARPWHTSYLPGRAVLFSVRPMNAYDPEALRPLILYADNHLLAVNKPPGLLSQDSGTGRPNLEDWAREWVRREKNKTGNVFLQAVHRLDTPVGGVVLFARTSKALSRLQADLRARRFRKTYRAVVPSPVRPTAARLVHHLAHRSRRAEVVPPNTRGAREARLVYRLLEERGPLALLEIELETGRYHQIRVQLAAAGFPILGDVKYGSSRRLEDGIIALHHVRLEVRHPTRREPLTVEAPTPDAYPWNRFRD